MKHYQYTATYRFGLSLGFFLVGRLPEGSFSLLFSDDIIILFCWGEKRENKDDDEINTIDCLCMERVAGSDIVDSKQLKALVMQEPLFQQHLVL